jgi:hypothetical protein
MLIKIVKPPLGTEGDNPRYIVPVREIPGLTFPAII